ncbi:MAG: hypothetical protein DRQ55_11830 [Planctomycetota bacterium]|nr:MAG: hypothetical protein DRQ55_11830 [Planctomycetota bacterium]
MTSRPQAAPLALLLSALVLALCLAPASAGQTFVDRLDPDDLRVVSYNVLWDTIFPNEDPLQAAKFVRVVAALDADVWCIQEIGYSTHVSVVISLFNDIAPLGAGAGWYGHKEGDCVIISRWPLSMQATSTIPAGDKGLAMALVDLPDADWPVDLYVMNNHYKCCGGNDHRRQKQSDAIVSWMRDARTAGGFIDLPAGTPMMVLGDLNIVDSFQPAQTLIDGDIIDEAAFGPDSPPDWDGSDALDIQPLHNVVGPADWTWFTPGPYPPGRLDFVITTDSVLQSVYDYSLNTTSMSPAQLSASGLLANDVTIDSAGLAFDHLPLVTDYRADASPWSDLGGALAGTAGEPALQGGGSLAGGSVVSLSLSAARPGASTALVIGFALLQVGFKGGVLVPSPDDVVFGLSTDGAGELVILDTWPAGIPSGLSFFAQHWITDPVGPQGFAASNGLQGTTP